MKKYKDIDEKIRLGYAYWENSLYSKASDIWLEAFEGIKAIYEEENIKSMREFDMKYNWHQPFLSNFVQDIDEALEGAGFHFDEYFNKRIAYNEEMIKLLDEDDQLTIENTRRAIADSHYDLGDEDECDRLYSNWLEADPGWGWGYVGWSLTYLYKSKKSQPNIKKAEEIILKAFEVKDIRDREDVLLHAISIYEDLGQDTKIQALERELKIHRKHPQTVMNPTKIGRNAPCPCGSGKNTKNVVVQIKAKTTVFIAS